MHEPMHDLVAQIVGRSVAVANTLPTETASGPDEITNVTVDVPQGSMLGPILWNAMDDEVFKLNHFRKVKIVDFANDVALLVVDETRKED